MTLLCTFKYVCLDSRVVYLCLSLVLTVRALCRDADNHRSHQTGLGARIAEESVASAMKSSCKRSE